VSLSLKEAIARITPNQRLLGVLVLVALAATHATPGSWNDESRMATVQSLVESGSLIIDKSDFVKTGDKVEINNHFYSDKPPIPSLLAAAVYLPLHQTGFELRPGRTWSYYLINLLTMKLFWLMGAVAFYLLLEYTGLSAAKRLLASFALALGSLYFSWSTTFNDHALAAAWLTIGFYFFLRARFERNIKLNLSLAAVFLSLAGTADMPTGIFYALFLPYVLLDRRLRSAVMFYVLPLLVTVLPSLAITYSIDHSIVPVQIVKSYFFYPGSPWIDSNEQLSGMSVNGAKFALPYAFLLLIGPRGFLLYNPFLWIALWGLVRTMRQKGRFFHEAIIVAAGSGILLLYYILFTSNYGGDSYSIRWLVPVLPLLFFFLYPYFEAYDQKRPGRFRALLAVSVAIALVGAINPWSSNRLSNVPFVANVIQLKRQMFPDFSVRHTLLGQQTAGVELR
jgi:hypothetical protein